MTAPRISPRVSDDLFDSSSMTFGEHLEQLRKALAKASIWVGAGLVIGLFFANNVVQYIQTPLKAELEEYYLKQDEARLKQMAGGKDLPPDLLTWTRANGFVSEDFFIDPRDLAFPTPSNASQPLETKTVEATKASEEAKPTDAASSETTKTASAATTAAQPSPTQANAIESRQVDIPDEGLVARLQPIRIWKQVSTKVETLNIQEGFMIWLKAALITGIVIGSPGIFWHIWEFVAAGLYPHERRYVYFFLPMSLGLFLSGVCLAFFVIFRYVIEFMLSMNAGLGTDLSPRLNEYVSFALILPLGFGVAFQLPLVMVFLNRIGMFTVQNYLQQWKIAILIIAFLSMVLTPSGDIYSMGGMGLPLVFLYFLGIALCKYLPMGRALGAEGYDPVA